MRQNLAEKKNHFTLVCNQMRFGNEIESSLHFISYIIFSPSSPNVHSERMACTKCFQCEYSHKAVCRRTKSKLRHCEMGAFNSTARICILFFYFCYFLLNIFEFIEKIIRTVMSIDQFFTEINDLF